MKRGIRLLVQLVTLAVGVIFIPWGVWAMGYVVDGFVGGAMMAGIGLLLVWLSLRGRLSSRFANRNAKPSY